MVGWKKGEKGGGGRKRLREAERLRETDRHTDRMVDTILNH